MIVVDGGGTTRTRRRCDVEAHAPGGLRLRGRLARGRARRHPHADLHVRHHRPAEGRAAHAREHDGGGAGLRRGDRASRTAGAWSPTCRWRTSPSAPARTTCRCCSASPPPTAPTRARWSPTCPRCRPDLVLRGAAHLGEAEGGDRGRRGGRARTSSASRRRSGRSDVGLREGQARAGRRAGPGGAARRSTPRPTSWCCRRSARGSASTRSSR